LALSSDPHAWLRPFFTRLQARPKFGDLAPAYRFKQLCDAVSVDHPNEAAQMRAWPNATQNAILAHLATSHEHTPPQVLSELWRMAKGDRELRCVVQYLSSGIDVRLFEHDAMRRSQLCQDAPEADAVSREWQAALLKRGWTLGS
jgi:hypothetical protein